MQQPTVDEINTAAASGKEKIATAAHTTADAIAGAGDYVRDMNVKSMLGDVQRLVKNNPGIALVAAAALGFITARSLSRN